MKTFTKNLSHTLLLTLVVTGCAAPRQTLNVVTLNATSNTVAKPVSTPFGLIVKTTISGNELNLSSYYSLNPDCSSKGDAALRLITPPTNGTISFEKSTDFTTFPKENQRYDCNLKPVPVMKAIYRSNTGYVGADSAVIEAIYPSGSTNKSTFTINVK